MINDTLTFNHCEIFNILIIMLNNHSLSKCIVKYSLRLKSNTQAVAAQTGNWKNIRCLSSVEYAYYSSCKAIKMQKSM